MQVNWIIITVFLFIVLALVVYLVRQNQKDQKKVTKYFNSGISGLDEEEELNNYR